MYDVYVILSIVPNTQYQAIHRGARSQYGYIYSTVRNGTTGRSYHVPLTVREKGVLKFTTGLIVQRLIHDSL